MDRNYSTDPRSIRARKAFHEALKELLQEKPFNKITVTGISRRAGLSRHTFYNHYETKEDLLNSLVDSILDDFFTNTSQIDNVFTPPASMGGNIGKIFFQAWQDNAELVKILGTLDMDRLLLDRLKHLFEDLVHQSYELSDVNANPELTRYIVSYSAHAVTAIWGQWLKDDMKYSPEVMGELLQNLADIGPRIEIIDRFQDVIR